MKKILTLIIILLCTTSLFAQTPDKFTYQAVVRNASNSLVANAQVAVRVSILQGSANGNAVYVERHSATTNANGLLTVEIGGGNIQQGSFADIDWANGPFFLKTETDLNGGSNYSITSVQQLLSVPYAIYAKEAGNGFSGDYNDLTNLPQIPQIPAEISAFNNDAGYLTSYTEQQILTISNDTIFLTGGSFVKLPAGFDGDYNSLTNRPDIPSTVGELTNDVNYITLEQVPAPVNADWNATEGAAEILNKPELFSGDYNDLTNTPVLFSGDYNDLTNTPDIPTVPTDISAFNNDAGYLISYTEQQILTISNDTIFLTGGSFVKLPAGFDGDYNSLTNKPTIPSTVGELTNDANYITLEQVPVQVNADWEATAGAAEILNKPTIPTVPTDVSAFNNDAGYITSYTESQILSISNDTIFLTGGSFVKLPTGFDGDYNSLTNKPTLFSGDYNELTNRPTIPTVPTDVSAFNNDAGYLTNYTETDPQFSAWDKDYNDLINAPVIPTVPANVSAFTNDAGYITAAQVQEAANIPTNVSAFTNDAGYITAVQVPGQVNADWNATTGAAQILNKPTIPTVPTNVSAFTNDVGYITAQDIPVIPTVPTNVSAFNNDAGYITMNSFPAIPTVPTNVSSFTNDASYVSNAACDGVDLCMLAALLTQLQYLVEQQQTRIEALESQLDSITSATTTNPTDTTYPSNSSAGILHGKFSISASQQVQFSQGNLQYQAASDTWRFAENQWDVIGADNSNISPTYTGWIDLFGWGTSGYNNKYPWMTSSTQTDYGDNQNNIANTNYDWGVYNSIQNGGDQPNLWRTLSSAEMNYMIYGRPNSENLYAMGVVNGRHGLIILPDDFILPNNISFYPAYKQFTEDFNNFTLNEWAQLENLGAVFLPVAGVRNGTTVTEIDESGYYWSSDILSPEDGAKEMWFGRMYIYYNPGIGGSFNRANGISVRLVKDYETSLPIDTFSTNYGIPCPNTPTITDYDGNTYNTVQIGNQCWMKENLRTKHYADGEAIPFNTDVSYSQPRCFQNNELNLTSYGLYYNWYATMKGSSSSNTNPSGVQGVCPNGWHVPSKSEWNQLLSYLGENQDYVCGNSNNNIAQSMAATVDWQEYPSSCTIGFDLSQQNSSGFSALPAGWFDVEYKSVGSYCGFMSSTLEEITIYPGSLGDYILTLSKGWSAPHDYVSWPYVSYSVRCVRD